MYSMRRHGKFYKIYEKSTGQHICQSKNKQKIQSILANLLTGGGFHGLTPLFMMHGGLVKYAENKG